MGRSTIRTTYIVGFSTLLIICGSCSRKASKTEPLPPPDVTVAHPHVQSVVDYREFTGRTAAIKSVEVRARVGGYLHSVDFEEGKEVAAGDLLFKIDPRPYEQILRQSKANFAAQKAQLGRLKEELTRANGLIASKAISKAELDAAIANASSGQAQLRSLKAAVSRSELDLEYTEIRSPIAGRTSRALVTPGNLIVEDTTVLTSVVSMDSIFAYFDIDESSALDYRQRVRGSEVESARETTIKIALGLSNEEGYPHAGVIDFVDNVTDVGTGNIQVRGRFENPDGALLPGLFCRIRVPFTRPYDALLIPQTALAMNQQGRYVVVVDEENKAQNHVVKIGAVHGDMVAIRSGLTKDDRVVTKGLQKARLGSVVNPVPDEEQYSTDVNSTDENSTDLAATGAGATSAPPASQTMSAEQSKLEQANVERSKVEQPSSDQPKVEQPVDVQTASGSEAPPQR